MSLVLSSAFGFEEQNTRLEGPPMRLRKLFEATHRRALEQTIRSMVSLSFEMVS